MAHISNFKNKNFNRTEKDRQVSKKQINKSNHFLESDNLGIETLFQTEKVGTKKG